MAPRDAAVSAARWLVGVSTVVVLAFIAATAIAQGVQRAITSRATELISNAMPSVKFLSSARGDLHRMEREIEHAETSDAERRDEFEQQAVSARQNLDAALASYEALPFFPHEEALFAHVAEALAVLDTHHAAWRDRASPVTLSTLRADVTLADAALERSISFAAAEGQRLGLQIEKIRGNSVGLVVLVDGIAVLFAVGVVVLALRQLQRAAHARHLEDAARERRETELRETNEALGQFAGRVAHDVLSPLSTTMLSLEVMRQIGRDDKAAVRASERGMAALQRVQALVDSLLAFARAGGKPEAGANAELESVLRDLVDGLSAQAQQQDIALTMSSIPAGCVACSPGVLTSIVSNLVGNALKYMGDAPERRVEILVTDAGAAWHLDVRDTGPGIPGDQQQRIFEPYVRVAKAGVGIGLGLATVDRLVRAHGGSVAVRSKVGDGSTFSVELPKFVEVVHATDVLARALHPVDG